MEEIDNRKRRRRTSRSRSKSRSKRKKLKEDHHGDKPREDEKIQMLMKQVADMAEQLKNFKSEGTNTQGPSTSANRDEHSRMADERRETETHDNKASRPVQQRTMEKSRADEAILAAERYKASIQQPPEGTCQNLDNELNSQVLNMKLARFFDSDDDEFFHITCHIDPSLRAKIRIGGFVELEKLLQKPEALLYKKQDRYQMSFIDGEQVWTQATDKSTKIDGIRKWEKAFRTYAAIYCESNPHRSVEILQYIESINDAAKKFSWEKVAHYDFVFRHLQAERPHRNWGKTYMQMYVRMAGNESSIQQQQPNRKPDQQNSSGTRIRACFRFNKGHCGYGKDCRFEHMCSYCGSYNHCYLDCRRKTHSKRRSSGGSRNNSEENSRPKERKKHHHERSSEDKKE